MRQTRRSTSKYKAKPTYVGDIRFASKKEAKRYEDLLWMQQAGDIYALKLQPKFPLEIDGAPVLIRSDRYPNGRRVSYIADFSYWQGEEMVVEDVKGMDTPLSRLKRGIVEAQYGIIVRLI